jgi:hypothetical protein
MYIASVTIWVQILRGDRNLIDFAVDRDAGLITTG